MRAARELLAALRLPRPLVVREDLPIGGVADLTNRGDLDRLLLSELAHDDLTLATRVALNEALYMRREPPLGEPPRTLWLLLDSGVRLWGWPRVFATAAALAREGAEVVVLDREVGALKNAIACDVTNPAEVRAAFDKVAALYGGVDIVVSNAGAAWQGRIGDVDDKTLRESFELNFWAHQSVAQNAVRLMRTQGLGGCLLFNTSKQAVNPGPDFGPYGLPKAATLFLSRQYALDHGGDGIRSNAVNADRIRSGLLTDQMIAERSKKRGLSEADYMGGNLLGLEVTADDVAQAFVALAKAGKTSGAVVTVDGGNIAAALR